VEQPLAEKVKEPAAAEPEEALAPEDAPPPSAAESEPVSEVDHSDGPSVVIQPLVGFGISTRSFHRPVMAGEQAMTSSVVPAAEVGLYVLAWPEAKISLAISLVYQSALGFTVSERPPLALMNEVRGRSERVSLDIGPGLRLGMVRVTVPIGATVRTLWPEVHTLMTPGYSLVGPHARIDVSLPLAGPVSLSFGPEVQWIVAIDQLLRESGVNSQGVALGVDVNLSVAVGSHFGLGVHYRESHASISTTRSFTFTDVERYLTLRGTGSF
jgi:hypothetical protein